VSPWICPICYLDRPFPMLHIWSEHPFGQWYRGDIKQLIAHLGMFDWPCPGCGWIPKTHSEAMAHMATCSEFHLKLALYLVLEAAK
jgi:hypothetical protein